MNSMFNDDYLVMSGPYKDIMNGTVIPWLETKQSVSMVSGFMDHPLYCVYYQADNPVGTVFIVHGFTENAFKYAELIFSLLNLHFSVVAYDQRGHGRSWRDQEVRNLSVTHVNHFSDYVEDLKIVCNAFREIVPGPRFLFAHSMGGAVSSLFMEQDPDFFKAAVLSAPMIAPNLGGIPSFLASAVAACAGLLGKQKMHPFFMKPYSGPEDFETSCATDPERFAWYDEIKASRAEFQNSVPSYGWSNESIHVTGKILAPGAPEKITCPVLLYSADKDSSVMPDPQKDFISRVSKGSQVFVKNSRHEIFRSTNDVLFPWWHEVVGFYHQHIGGEG